MREYMNKSSNNNINNNKDNNNKGNNRSNNKDTNKNNNKNHSKNNKTPDHGKQVTSKQVVAIVGVLLLVLLYIGTLFAAIFDSSESGRWFVLCIFATVAIPILLWIYTWMYGKLTGRHTIADTNDFLKMDNRTPSDAGSGKSNITDNGQ